VWRTLRHGITVTSVVRESRRTIDDVRRRAPLRSLAAFHAAAPESMRELVGRLADADPSVTAIQGRIGPVVGTYSGPGGVGVACLASG